jgi:hypothetical protein
VKRRINENQNVVALCRIEHCTARSINTQRGAFVWLCGRFSSPPSCPPRTPPNDKMQRIKTVKTLVKQAFLYQHRQISFQVRHTQDLADLNDEHFYCDVQCTSVSKSLTFLFSIALDRTGSTKKNLFQTPSASNSNCCLLLLKL